MRAHLAAGARPGFFHDGFAWSCRAFRDYKPALLADGMLQELDRALH